MKTRVKMILVFGVLVFFVYACFRLTVFNDKVITACVTGKERVNSTEGSKYLVFAQDQNGNPVVFENTDSFLRMKFNSSDFYAGIYVGCVYDFTVIGYRVPIFGWYQNIIDYEERRNDHGTVDK